MEISAKKLEEILKKQRKEFQKYTKILSEEAASNFKLVSEQYGSIKETLDTHTDQISSIKETLDTHTNQFSSIKETQMFTLIDSLLLLK